MQALPTEVPGSEHELRSAEQVAALPMRMGGLGMRSASSCAPAAYWASWSDTLHMIHQRTPAVGESVVTALGQEEQLGGCVGELQEAAERLDHEGFWWRPSWEALRRGERPPLMNVGEPGEWTHGWQFVKPYCRSSGALEVALWTQRWCSSPPQPRNSPSLPICSVFWCWNASICPFPSLRQFVKVAVRLWTFATTTERRA